MTTTAWVSLEAPHRHRRTSTAIPSTLDGTDRIPGRSTQTRLQVRRNRSHPSSRVIPPRMPVKGFMGSGRRDLGQDVCTNSGRVHSPAQTAGIMQGYVSPANMR
jgi:hypothetical protein